MNIMAPPKVAPKRGTTTKRTTLLPLARKTISTRSQNLQDQNIAPVAASGKRKTDKSPLKNDEKKTRSALGNLTNNVTNLYLRDKKRNVVKPKTIKENVENIVPDPNITNASIVVPPTKTNKRITRAATKNVPTKLEPYVLVPPSLPEIPTTEATCTTTKSKEKDYVDVPNKPPTRRISEEFDKTDDSLYMSALEDIPTDISRFSGAFESKRKSLSHSRDSLIPSSSDSDNEGAANRINTPSPLKNPPIEVPDDILNFDKETWDDPFQVSQYAMDVFNYLKHKESQFPIANYMEEQIYLNKGMRTLLVDWMVEVQETFELNHETLYLAVKLVDIYLSKEIVTKEKLQLLGAASLFIACKYDERTPPLVDDFLYVCDGAYDHNQLIKMEKQVLKTINFELGIPLSYRFLRRYARCAKIPMSTLTLARYILELSLMDYGTISFSDSQLACAALYIALKMISEGNPWSKTLQFYSGYNLEDFAYIVPVLNAGLHRKPKETIKTIRTKYSHKIFFEVSKIPLKTTEALFEETGLLKSLKD